MCGIMAFASMRAFFAFAINLLFAKSDMDEPSKTGAVVGDCLFSHLVCHVLPAVFLIESFADLEFSIQDLSLLWGKRLESFMNKLIAIVISNAQFLVTLFKEGQYAQFSHPLPTPSRKAFPLLSCPGCCRNSKGA
jgi:hypothetical protein